MKTNFFFENQQMEKKRKFQIMHFSSKTLCKKTTFFNQN